MKKFLLFSATALALTALTACSSTTSTSSNSSSSSSISSSSSSSASTAKWTQADYDALVSGDVMNKGAGGSNYDEVIAKFGKPTSSTDATIADITTKTVMYLNINGDLGSSVTLQFDKQEDGSWLLVSKAASGLK